MRPRIYTYKITFEEVPYYYYGMHQEKVFGEEYWGSSVTHKWCWKFYTPKKQILEIFDNRIDAYEVEKRLIKPVYQTDKWCLNECCAGVYSIQSCSKAGKIGGSISGQKHKKNKTGIFAQTSEERMQHGKIGGNKNVESGHIQKLGKKTSQEHMKNKKGIFGLDEEKRKENARKAGKRTKELGVGVFSMSKEERSELSKRISKQKWMCLETGFISSACGLARYQMSRGIDKSLKVRIE
jgi:hypothetical protein